MLHATITLRRADLFMTGTSHTAAAAADAPILWLQPDDRVMPPSILNLNTWEQVMEDHVLQPTTDITQQFSTNQMDELVDVSDPDPAVRMNAPPAAARGYESSSSDGYDSDEPTAAHSPIVGHQSKMSGSSTSRVRRSHPPQPQQRIQPQRSTGHRCFPQRHPPPSEQSTHASNHKNQGRRTKRKRSPSPISSDESTTSSSSSSSGYADSDSDSSLDSPTSDSSSVYDTDDSDDSGGGFHGRRSRRVRSRYPRRVRHQVDYYQPTGPSTNASASDPDEEVQEDTPTETSKSQRRRQRQRRRAHSPIASQVIEDEVIEIDLGERKENESSAVPSITPGEIEFIDPKEEENRAHELYAAVILKVINKKRAHRKVYVEKMGLRRRKKNNP